VERVRARRVRVRLTKAKISKKERDRFVSKGSCRVSRENEKNEREWKRWDVARWVWIEVGFRRVR